METSASSLYRLVDEDDELVLGEEDFMPRKRRSVDVGDGVAWAVNLMRATFRFARR